VLATPDYQLIASHTIDPDRNYWRKRLITEWSNKQRHEIAHRSSTKLGATVVNNRRELIRRTLG
jgi:hypothetical protein